MQILTYYNTNYSTVATTSTDIYTNTYTNSYTTSIYIYINHNSNNSKDAPGQHRLSRVKRRRLEALRESREEDEQRHNIDNNK